MIPMTVNSETASWINLCVTSRDTGLTTPSRGHPLSESHASWGAELWKRKVVWEAAAQQLHQPGHFQPPFPTSSSCTSPASGSHVYLEGGSKGMWPLFYLPKWVAVKLDCVTLDCVIARTGLSAPGPTPTITLLLHIWKDAMPQGAGGTACHLFLTNVCNLHGRDRPWETVTGVPWQRRGIPALYQQSPHSCSEQPNIQNLCQQDYCSPPAPPPSADLMELWCICCLLSYSKTAGEAGQDPRETEACGEPMIC